MKKIILIISLLSSLILYGIENPYKIPIDENDYLKRFSILLDRYELFMEQNGNINSDYYTAFLLHREKLQNFETKFTLSMENHNLIDDGARFNYNKESGEYFISVGYKLVDIFDNYPSLVFTILTHEIWHAYAYLTNMEVFPTQEQDPFEQIMYEFDAIVVEARFVSEVIFNSNLVPSNFETFLGKSFNNNGISGITSALLKADYHVFYDLYNMRNDYYKNKDKVLLDNRLGELGENLLLEYSNNKDSENQWFKYQLSVAMHNFYHYTTILFKQTEGVENPTQKWEDIFNSYPKFYIAFKEIQELYNSGALNIDEKHQEYIGHFNNNLL